MNEMWCMMYSKAQIPLCLSILHTQTHTHLNDSVRLTRATCSALSSLVTVATISWRQSSDVTRPGGCMRLLSRRWCWEIIVSPNLSIKKKKMGRIDCIYSGITSSGNTSLKNVDMPIWVSFSYHCALTEKKQTLYQTSFALDLTSQALYWLPL